MFEKAIRMKLRFTTPKGQISVEDLWELPLLSTTANMSLDDIARGLSKAIKESAGESFVIKKNTANAVLEFKLDIVKHIIAVKLDEEKARKKAAENKARKNKILDILADKEDEELKEMPKAALKKMVKKL